MALHLMNGDQNEHVTVHQVKGFVASDVFGALNEAYALSKGTQCKQFMYSLSLNPPQDKIVPIEIFENTLQRIEQRLGLEGQPRVVVFHEKEGRRHAHCVWSRIDTDNMKAINISHPKLKLTTIAKQLYLENGWKMPEGFIDKSQKNPLNYTRAEWQQAARAGKNPKAIKATLQECWAASDNKKAFEHILEERGYYLAKGDRRGFVVVDIQGEVYSLPRQLGLKKKEIEQRLGKAETLLPVSEVKSTITGRLSKLFKSYSDELKLIQQKEKKPLLQTKRAMTHQHRMDRAAQKAYHEKRWQAEELKRSSKIRRGFKGLWDKLNGKYWKTRKQNEQEAGANFLRDRKEKEDLIAKQLAQRQELQKQLIFIREKHEKEWHNLLSSTASSLKSKYKASNEKNTQQTKSLSHQIPDRNGPEPEM